MLVCYFPLPITCTVYAIVRIFLPTPYVSSRIFWACYHKLSHTFRQHPLLHYFWFLPPWIIADDGFSLFCGWYSPLGISCFFHMYLFSSRSSHKQPPVCLHAPHLVSGLVLPTSFCGFLFSPWTTSIYFVVISIFSTPISTFHTMISKLTEVAFLYFPFPYGSGCPAFKVVSPSAWAFDW